MRCSVESGTGCLRQEEMVLLKVTSSLTAEIHRDLCLEMFRKVV